MNEQAGNAVKGHKRIVLLLSLIVLGMFGFGFALVPIYNSLCQTLGINGKTNSKAAAYNSAQAFVDKNRVVTVQFVSTSNSSLPWAFYPKVTRINVHPGEIAKLAFYAENKSNFRMTVQAIPSVTPGIAAKYLKKTECFCFTQQTLNGHEAMDMPLLFHLDNDLPAEIKTITLSYTLFDVTNRVIN
ncbi:cytochrome c oxidase assembly protein [Legionella taurinensis]|uniref:Cytochrome c oxidase assembly protein CtaG n=1 Tax=Legionella taurinensis TaxID=70611 RepID=A0A3A5L4J9_9GAMM|nr:cytochrome c oxidase assembly protein [Legionella taurinensis]MDX1836129.1 cytochrome c oxidase assembly protein [Legionella taurinensis]PUT42098.1 cytochrome c oxidase assembly protein [Legionella taurinensis]PUT44885.1 cytochrome c oxidase assembly protein [Legionella taurinensis]PUT48206.1 cytochrome c oxidase assembly protein [Legionella taurinensis]PUT49020.1 cytochrome c oxidase assembly protein [Legionella taurinensis]